MRRQELNQASPLRILDKETHGGLTPGQLGVVIAQPGVGKTTFLVQIGLDHLLRDEPVLHLASGHTVDHLQAWYDALFDDLANIFELEERESIRPSLHKKSVIHTFGSGPVDTTRIDRVLGLYCEHQGFKPRAIIVEGFDWNSGPDALQTLKKQAEALGTELWLAARTQGPDGTPTEIPAPCTPFEPFIDVALYLEPDGDHVNVSLLKEHDDRHPHPTGLELCGDTLRARKKGVANIRLPKNAYTLLSGGAKGAEAEFGRCAEAWGLREQNFTFLGHTPERTRGLVMLSESELEEGHVTDGYIKAQLHREFPKTPRFQKLLQSIWHQVMTAAEVFVVGTILEDQTVKGGTGWAAELGRHLDKPVYVYEQEKKQWYAWAASKWMEIAPPSVTHTRFAGTGTRFVNEDGRRAIEGLFERSFGALER